MQYAPHGACEPSCGACRSYAKEAMRAVTAVERSRLLSLVFYCLYQSWRILLECVLDSVVGHHSLLESVSTCLG